MQEDADKKINLSSGQLMEHDPDVCLWNEMIVHWPCWSRILNSLFQNFHSNYYLPTEGVWPKTTSGLWRWQLWWWDLIGILTTTSFSKPISLLSLHELFLLAHIRSIGLLCCSCTKRLLQMTFLSSSLLNVQVCYSLHSWESWVHVHCNQLWCGHSLDRISGRARFFPCLLRLFCSGFVWGLKFHLSHLTCLFMQIVLHLHLCNRNYANTKRTGTVTRE